MPIIYDKALVAAQLLYGVQVLAETETSGNITAMEYELAQMLNKEARTIKSWKSASSMPGSLKDYEFYGIIWLVLRTRQVSLQWVEDLLSGTSVSFLKPIPPDWLKGCLRQARLSGEAPSDKEIEELVDWYFLQNQVGDDFSYIREQLSRSAPIDGKRSTASRDLLRIQKPLSGLTQHLIRTAKEVCINGLTLFRYVPSYHFDLVAALEQGTVVRMMLVDPDSPAFDMVVFRSASALNADMQQQQIMGVLEQLEQIRASAPHSKLEVRFTDYMPPYGITIYQHREDPAKSVCTVRLYTFRTPTPYAPVIIPHPIDDAFWFNFFSEQFEALWKAAYVRD